MVHQHFKLIPAFTVMENIVLGDRSYKIFKEQKFISKIKKTIRSIWAQNRSTEENKRPINGREATGRNIKTLV